MGTPQQKSGHTEVPRRAQEYFWVWAWEVLYFGTRKAGEYILKMFCKKSVAFLILLRSFIFNMWGLWSLFFITLRRRDAHFPVPSVLEDNLYYCRESVSIIVVNLVIV